MKRPWGRTDDSALAILESPILAGHDDDWEDEDDDLDDDDWD